MIYCNFSAICRSNCGGGSDFTVHRAPLYMRMYGSRSGHDGSACPKRSSDPPGIRRATFMQAEWIASASASLRRRCSCAIDRPSETYGLCVNLDPLTVADPAQQHGRADFMRQINCKVGLTTVLCLRMSRLADSIVRQNMTSPASLEPETSCFAARCYRHHRLFRRSSHVLKTSHNQQEVKVIRQKAPHGEGGIPRLGVTPGGRNLYH